MSRSRVDELFQRAELARSASRQIRERSSETRELRALHRAAKSVEAELETAVLTSSASERAEVGDALSEARSLRVAIEELLEQVNAGGGPEGVLVERRASARRAIK
jgi:hypothetical protein